MMKFNELIDTPELLKVLDELGFEQPTPIQEMAIGEVLAGNDVRGSAQTGTGKTAAFLLPILSKLKEKNEGRGPRALILLPTRELCMQVAQEAIKLTRYLPHIKSVAVFGGVPYPQQNKQLSQPYDILIATPGRLIDHIEQRRVDLGRLEMLVLDEADRMLDMGFIEPVEYVASLSPDTRQTLLFSATFGKKVIKLAKTLLKDPVEVSVAPQEQRHEQIEQFLHPAENLEHKQRLLEYLLSDEAIDQAIVFSSTKMQVKQLADKLRYRGFKAAALHGDMDQRQRTRTMHQMREGKIQILVATDVAARGIDVQTISHVINFDLPNSVEDYIHRIGRTGRAGSKGVARSFASSRDAQVRKEIEKFTGLKATKLVIPQREGEAPVENFEEQEPVEERAPFQKKKREHGGFSRERSRFPKKLRHNDREQTDAQSKKPHFFEQKREQSREQSDRNEVSKKPRFSKPFEQKRPQNREQIDSERPRFPKPFGQKREEKPRFPKPRSNTNEERAGAFERPRFPKPFKKRDPNSSFPMKDKSEFPKPFYSKKRAPTPFGKKRKTEE